jgi:lon-related putative ATP-dependent protease
MAPRPLPPDRLRRICPPEDLPFETTAELADPDGPLGQERAAEALAFGTAVKGPGYNVFVLGPPGLGKHRFVKRVLEKRAAVEPPAHDWCYLNDFAAAQRPRALRLPPGRARPLQLEMERLVEDLRASIPAVFESEDYRSRLQVLEKQLDERRGAAMKTVREHAAARDVAVVQTPAGFAVAPVRGGEVIDPEQFHQLPEEEQRRIQESMAAVQQELQAALRGMPQLEREHREKVKELNREAALYAAQHLLDDLRKRYADLPEVLAHLDAVQADVVENVHDFLGSAEAEDAAGQIRKLFTEGPALRRYQVNVMVDNADARGAPVVYEDRPSYADLAGRIEHHAHFGTLVTDFTMIRPGALHRANGGYLVLDAQRLLGQPLAWEHLKRSLAAGAIRIDPPERLYGLSSAASLEPEPMPLSVKVVLLGDRRLYYLLAAHDPEFLEHFKVAADFEDEIPRQGNHLGYARMLAMLARDEKLRPLSSAAMACVLEEGARRAGDSEKLTARLQALMDLLREADHCAGQAGRDVVSREDVQAAVESQVRRQSRVRERILEEIARGTLLVDTGGVAVGQVNGLSVLQLGDFAFGRPSRITARVRLGKGEVVDIEREVELGGPIHSKGVLILSGFLGARYATRHPLSLSASLVFEQSYGGVEGDSASLAELCALLSALAEVPIKQTWAMTGSVNQHGHVQPIGGVNEKIEGFFDVCKARGLTGDQGVLIPVSNVQHLMLRPDVVEAVVAGQFHVYPVETVDQAIELLTGIPAGERDETENFPEGSINQRVEARLMALAEIQRDFAAPPEEMDRDEETGEGKGEREEGWV